MHRDTRTWLGRLAAVALLAFSLGYIPYHVYARSGLARTIALRRDLAALEAKNVELRADNARLLHEASALRSDLGAIERVARRDLGWVRPGEIIFQIDEAAARPVEHAAARPVDHAAARPVEHAAARPVDHAAGRP